jgi:hypothetical protein
LVVLVQDGGEGGQDAWGFCGVIFGVIFGVIVSHITIVNRIINIILDHVILIQRKILHNGLHGSNIKILVKHTKPGPLPLNHLTIIN